MSNSHNSYQYVDAHCHVDLFQNPHGVLRDAAAQAVFVIAMTNAPSVFASTRSICTQHENAVPSLGLHPELAHERHSELRLFSALLPATSVIGEVGLDRVRSSPHAELQRRVFERILSESSGAEKILSIHSRGAVPEVLTMLRTRFVGTAILHWFTGSIAHARLAASAGYYFSANRLMLRSSAGRELLRWVPGDLLLTESDGPLGRIDRTPCCPSDIPKLVRELSELRETDEPLLRSALLDNARRVFGDAIRVNEESW